MRDINEEMIANQTYIIFASDESDSETKKYMKKVGVKYKEVKCKHISEEETAFIINSKNRYLIEPFIENQDSVLELSKIQSNGLRAAGLRLNQGSYINLGHFNMVSKEEAEKTDSYTYDPLTNYYFVAQ